ncbi:sensor domain-containing diguanylate cyclase [Photobacterium ganghwense]|uniref:diguanylate cyclase n=1 Tax=Photobacterium ganghwense TaxID=320778 RepID=A0A0J1K4Q2_9GAMM|nr:diguanylate cyclase [Photobacterium ganghwense]KLV09367.1 hypothetical protein ABT57_11120 [Photobacterium ganghwense]PSU08515.1 sensor domain-containing diguanylate cyclase [Photobacterium ganghwense]
MTKTFTYNLTFKLQMMLMTLLAMTALPIVMLWYHNSEKVMFQTIERLYQYSSANLKERLDEQFQDARQIFEQQTRIRQELINIVADSSLLLDHIVTMLNHHYNVDYYYFANPQGGLLSFGYSNGGFTLLQSAQEKAGPLNSFTTNFNGQKRQFTAMRGFFDARERDWYKDSLKTDQPVWSKMYPGAVDTSLLGISLTKAFRDEAGKLLGVWGVDLTLNSLIKELKSNKLSDNGEVLLFNNDGQILASTDKRHTLQNGQLPSINKQATPVISQLLRQNTASTDTVKLVDTGQQQWVALTSYYQLAQNNVINILFYSPLSDFSPPLNTVKRAGLLFTIVISLLALFIGALATRHVLKPIHQLILATRRIREGDLHTRIPLKRRDEVGLLADNFNQMSDHLVSTLQALRAEQDKTLRLNALLEEQNHSLETRVAIRTRELKAANQKLKHMAYSDYLTGIANRRSFWERLENDSQCQPGWLLLMDLDNFKRVNDQYGHHIGDNILKHFAQVCDGILRHNLEDSEALFGRIGGEEFAIWLPGIDDDTVQQLSSQLMDGLKKCPYLHNGQSIYVSTSIGASYCQQDPHQAYATADQRLYDAKEKGKNQAVLSS